MVETNLCTCTCALLWLRSWEVQRRTASPPSLNSTLLSTSLMASLAQDGTSAQWPAAARKPSAAPRLAEQWIAEMNRISGPCPAPGTWVAAPPPGRVLTFIALNVRGMIGKYMLVFDFLKRGGWHVAVISEAHCVSEAQAYRWVAEAGWEGFISCSADPGNPTGHAGVLVLVSQDAPVSNPRKGGEVAGRARLVLFQWGSRPCGVVGLYAPTQQAQRLPFYRDQLQPLLCSAIEVEPSLTIIQGGDHNLVTDERDVLCTPETHQTFSCPSSLAGGPQRTQPACAHTRDACCTARRAQRTQPACAQTSATCCAARVPRMCAGWLGSLRASCQ